MFYRHSVGSYEKSCRGMPFVSEVFLCHRNWNIEEKRQTSTILVIRLFCIKTFSSGVFFRFIHDFRRIFPKILWIQPESATRRGSRVIDKLLLSFLVSMRAIYFRALRTSAEIAFKGSPWVCGHAVNSQILLLSSYLGSIGIAAEENGYNVTF